MSSPLRPEDFAGLYEADPDPWRLTSSEYERRKYGRTLEMVARAPGGRCFEPGCSVGVLTAGLVGLGLEVEAWDVAKAAVVQARRRAPGARVRTGAVPARWPSGPLDVVVLSELLYYLDAPARRGVHRHLERTLRPGGEVVAVHWVHPFAEAAGDGRTVHAELAELGWLSVVETEDGGDVVLTRLVRSRSPDPASR